ncbi:MAG TPA: hypothetical protein VIM89_01910 [Mucilaginibacter sp.]
MSIPIILFLIVCILLLWVTIAGKELYPFSYYPMYSAPHDLKNISVFRIAIEKKDGGIVWWQSEFYRYPEYSGRKLQQLWAARINNQQQEIFLQLEQYRLLISVLQIMEKENINTHEYSAFHIIERTINANLKPVNKTIEIIPLNRLKR